ncbi:hypothetical protein [Streptacidiphilus sp. PAMC 29251]
MDLLTPRRARSISASKFIARTASRVSAVVAELRGPVVQQTTQVDAEPVEDPTDLFTADDMPAVDLVEAAAREFHRAADQARRADRGKRAAKKILDRLPAGTYGAWLVERIPSTRQTADLDAIRAIFKANGLGPVPMKTSAPSLKVKAVVVAPETGVCATCDRAWDVSDLGEDGNGDAQCTDCASVSAGLDDRAEHRAYASR